MFESDQDHQDPHEQEPPADESPSSSPESLTQRLEYAAVKTMELGALLRQPAIDSLRGADSALEAFKQITPLLDMLLRVDRQIDRYANIVVRLQGAEAKKAPFDTYSAQLAAAQRQWDLETNASRRGPSRSDGRPPR